MKKMLMLVLCSVAMLSISCQHMGKGCGKCSEKHDASKEKSCEHDGDKKSEGACEDCKK